MKKIHLAILALCAAALFSSCKPSEAPPAAPSANTPKSEAAQPATPLRKTSFQDVTAQLDHGGDVFVYLSPEKWLSGLSTNLEGLRDLALSGAGMPDDQREHLNAAFGSAIRLLQASGIEDLDGVGLSGVQIAPQLYRSKFVLQHRSGKEKGFLWSAFGNAPHPLRSLEFLPANTGLAAFGDLEVAQVWDILQRELVRAGIPELAQWAENWPKLFEAQTKISWSQLLQSLDGEVGMLLTLDETRPVKLPIGEGVEFPAPAILMAIRVRNDLLYDRISSDIRKNKNAVVTNEPGLKLSSLSFPLPLPVRVELVAASTGDYLFVGSSVPLVRSLVAVRQGKEPGLRQQPEFQQLARHVPSEGNNVIYLSRGLSGAFQNIQRQAIRSQKGGDDKQLAAIERLLLGNEPTVMLSVGGQTASGWQTVSVGNTDSAAVLLAAPAVGAVAMWSGMAFPALAKARARAQTINTVNQMKQINLAARIYASEHDGKFPPAGNWCDALKDELAGKVLKSPADKGEGECSYACNSKLSGLNAEQIHPQTVAFFETEAGWNQHGGPELLLAEPRNPAVYVIGFADGSVQQIPQSKMNSLRWDP